jgi:acyltransferase
VQLINNRHDWVDALRAIGIVLVVLGHTLGISEGVEKYIFSFHMPLFFFISGLVLTPTRLSHPFVEALRHYGRRLLLPYLLFSLLTYLPWVLVTRHYGADAALGVEAWRPVIGTFYGVGVDSWLQHNAMLWFFPCLFVTHLVFRMVYALMKGCGQYVMITVIAGLGYLLSSVLPVRLPWGVEIALIALPFYALGQTFALRDAWLPRAGLSTALLLLLFAALQFTCIAINGRVDMNFISIGNPLLFYLGAVSGIGALACLVTFLPPLSVFARLADAAVLAFPLHRTLFSVFSACGLLLVHDLQAFKLGVWGSVTYTVGALLLSVLLLPWVRRCCPVLIGGR